MTQCSHVPPAIATQQKLYHFKKKQSNMLECTTLLRKAHTEESSATGKLCRVDNTEDTDPSISIHKRQKKQ